MQSFQKLLFYYSIILSTVLLIGTVFFMPEPVNFIIAASIIPITLYFWLYVSSPGNVSVSQWSLRLILITGIFSALGLFAYSFARKPLPAAPSEAQEDSQSVVTDEIKSAIENLRDEGGSEAILETLESIREELVEIKSDQKQLRQIVGPTGDESLTNILTDLETPTELGNSLGSVTPKNSGASITVFKTTSSTSEHVGILKFGESYPFFKSQGSWYQVILPTDEVGWVSASLVLEVE